MTMLAMDMMLATTTPAFRNLAALFAGGVDGVIIDFTDKDTLFQDANGIAPVVNNGDPVGFALDQHKWGGLTLAAYRAAQAELMGNAEFASDVSGWTVAGSGTLTWASGKAIFTVGSGAPIFFRSVTTVVGRWYEVSFKLDAISGVSSATISVTSGGNPPSVAEQGISGVATHRRFFKAPSTTMFVNVQQGITGSTTTWDSISVKEIDGHHATQSGSARPTWASATGDVAFNGSSQFLTVADFDFPSTDCALAVWAKSNTANRVFVGAGLATSGVFVTHANTGVGRLFMGDKEALGTTVITGTYKTILADKHAVKAELVVDGITEGTLASPTTTAVTLDIAIGAGNVSGTPTAFMAGNIKRVIALQARAQDTMIAADIHANLIAA